jgi:hypothetical protein
VRIIFHSVAEPNTFPEQLRLFERNKLPPFNSFDLRDDIHNAGIRCAEVEAWRDELQSMFLHRGRLSHSAADHANVKMHWEMNQFMKRLEVFEFGFTDGLRFAII